MKTWITLLLTSALVAAAPMVDFSDNQKIAVQNSILAQVNGKTISMIDIKKKMDLLFHQHYPQLAGSNQARVQFYEASWRHVLMDTIDNELIIADALDKEIKLTDGEVRETMEERFGPNVMQTLDKIGLTYDETWKMVKNELIVQRMSWFFVQSRAISSVTPQDIRQAYRLYLEKNPPYTEWKYRVVSIRADQANDSLSEQVYELLAQSDKQSPDALQEELKKLEIPGSSITVSNEYTAKTHELSDIHKASLSALEPGNYSKPAFQTGRDKKATYRIFYLVDKADHPAPLFEDMSNQLRNELMQKAVGQESQAYISKLRKHYGFEAAKTLPEDLHPFSLQ